MKPSVKYQVIFTNKDRYKISEMCRFFNVSRSGYYAYLKQKNNVIEYKNINIGNLGYKILDKVHPMWYNKIAIWYYFFKTYNCTKRYKGD